MRTIEIFDEQTKLWVGVNFSDLKNGDIFRIFDDGERYIDKDNGEDVWRASGYPYINNDGIWTIKTVF